ncbi:MAG: 23S rRNA (guanosine(2251)-2'-O)-methyltransferase RlmB [Alphaproteobacteria bacterium CG_4_9_14_3_um_filter_47_13]|nr:MAG: 23S rRNA (guanosine(2251)-2'-O)-methyltransferase RlmB [Alphaproteobacteria bacterium CG_4_9_14_3_um_filter_47_13]
MKKYKQPYKNSDKKRQYTPEKKRRIAANLWGTHAVREAWLNQDRTVRGLYITEDALGAFKDILSLRKTPPSVIEKKELDRLLPPGAVHQGIALHTEPLPEVFIQDLIIKTKNIENTIILMLDQVTDPHNVGAILRSASAFGAAGVIMQRKYSPELTGTLAKTASGAVEHISVAYEINLSDTLDLLKENGFFAMGLDERGDQSISHIKKEGKIVLVLGAEGTGLRPKVREHCDHLVRLPTQGAIASLNVSNAAAVALYALVA